MTVPPDVLGIDFAAMECEIDLGTGITDLRIRLFEADEKRKNPAGDIDLVPYGLPPILNLALPLACRESTVQAPFESRKRAV